jgi:DNA-binding transcriptional regulator GbsR (MarR family)
MTEITVKNDAKGAGDKRARQADRKPGQQTDPQTDLLTGQQTGPTPAMQRFILHWGDLGQAWGVNRSVAQIHALLFVSARPMTAEEIADRLSLARSNVSNSIRDLLAWGLVRKSPVFGERRDHFEAEGDVMEMVAKIVALRKARELDPAAAVLDQCLLNVKSDPEANAEAVRRMEALQDLVMTLTNWYEQMNKVPRAKLLPLMRLGSKAVDILAPFLGKKK